MRRTFSSLGFFNYRLWFAGAMVSNVGTWMQRVAQDWLVLTVLTDESGVAVGIVTALQFLPFLLFSAWAGVLADRLDQRRLLIVLQSASAVLGVSLGALVLLEQVQLWHVYLLAALLGLVSAIDAPLRQTFVAGLVPLDRLSNAVGLNSASFNAARLIGPAAAGLLIAGVGSGWVFIINGFTYVGTIFALASMRRQELVPVTRAAPSRGQIREGIRYVRGRPDIVAIIVVVGVVSMFGFNFQLTSALMARVEFGMGATEYGVLGSIMAIGSLGGALVAARRPKAHLRLVIGAAFGFGMASGLMALMPTYFTYAVMCIPVGFAALTMMTAANATIQTTCEPSLRGRVLALYMMTFLGATPFGSPIIGWVGETFGARWSIGVGAIAALLVAGGAAAWGLTHFKLKVSYHFSRPHVQVRQVEPRFARDAERATRQEAARTMRAQQIESGSRS